MIHKLRKLKVSFLSNRLLPVCKQHQCIYNLKLFSNQYDVSLGVVWCVEFSNAFEICWFLDMHGFFFGCKLVIWGFFFFCSDLKAWITWVQCWRTTLQVKYCLVFATWVFPNICVKLHTFNWRMQCKKCERQFSVWLGCCFYKQTFVKAFVVCPFLLFFVKKVFFFWVLLACVLQTGCWVTNFVLVSTAWWMSCGGLQLIVQILSRIKPTWKIMNKSQLC